MDLKHSNISRIAETALEGTNYVVRIDFLRDF